MLKYGIIYTDLLFDTSPRPMGPEFGKKDKMDLSEKKHEVSFSLKKYRLLKVAVIILWAGLLFALLGFGLMAMAMTDGANLSLWLRALVMVVIFAVFAICYVLITALLTKDYFRERTKRAAVLGLYDAAEAASKRAGLQAEFGIPIVGEDILAKNSIFTLTQLTPRRYNIQIVVSTGRPRLLDLRPTRIEDISDVPHGISLTTVDYLTTALKAYAFGDQDG